MSHFTMPLYRALESNMGARKDRACEGAMHSPWSEVGTFLVARQGHLTQCMHCTPLYDRWTAQISLRDLGLNGAWKKKKSFDIYLYGHKEKLFIFLIMFTPAKKLIMTLCLLEAVELRAMYENSYAVRGWPFDCWVVIWGMGDLRKNILQTDFEGRKNIARKYLDWKKYLLWDIIL